MTKSVTRFSSHLVELTIISIFNETSFVMQHSKLETQIENTVAEILIKCSFISSKPCNILFGIFATFVQNASRAHDIDILRKCKIYQLRNDHKKGNIKTYHTRRDAEGKSKDKILNKFPIFSSIASVDYTI